jgi:hypothetical protein
MAKNELKAASEFNNFVTYINGESKKISRFSISYLGKKAGQAEINISIKRIKKLKLV